MDEVASTNGLHIAQFNLAVLRHPLGHPGSQGFVDLIDDTNAHAEAAPGFVWRHGIDTRDDDLPYDDQHITVNASVWESPQHLREFAYRGFHRDVYRRRAEWFVDSAAVMWWIDAGHVPTLHECLTHMDVFGEFGSTWFSFTTGERVPVLVVREHDADDPSVAAARPSGQQGGTRLHVAWVDGTPVASVERLEDGAAWVLRRLWVPPDLRRHRIGAALLAHVQIAARDAGIAALRAERGPTDEATATDRLLQRMGFLDDQWPVRPITEWNRPPRDAGSVHPH